MMARGSDDDDGDGRPSLSESGGHREGQHEPRERRDGDGVGLRDVRPVAEVAHACTGPVAEVSPSDKIGTGQVTTRVQKTWAITRLPAASDLESRGSRRDDTRAPFASNRAIVDIQVRDGP